MIFLEDYIDTIDGLPADLKQNLERIREMDKGSRQAQEQAELKIKNNFNSGRVKKTDDNKNDVAKAIRKEYNSALQLSDEKIQVATQSCSMLERYIERLNGEIKKCAQEFDQNKEGHSKEIEKSSLLMDEHGVHAVNNTAHTKRLVELENNILKKVRVISETNRKTLKKSTHRVRKPRAQSQATVVSSSEHTTLLFKTSSSGSKLVGKTGTAPSTAGLSSSVKGANQANTTHLTQDISANAVSKSSVNTKSAIADPLAATVAPYPAVNHGTELGLINTSELISEATWCYCNQVSYGEMVGCDNDDCIREWFHYACVGITEPPKGKWFCLDCTASMKRRK